MKKIIATLDYGMTLSKPLLVLLWVGLVCSVAAIPGFIAGWLTENDVFWLYFIAFPLLAGLIFLYVIVHDIIHKKNIEKWLADAVELSAVTEIIYNSDVDKVSNV